MEIVHGDVEVGEDLFHGYAAVLFQLGDAGLDAGGFARRERLVVDGRQRQFAVEGRQHGLE